MCQLVVFFATLIASIIIFIATKQVALVYHVFVGNLGLKIRRKMAQTKADSPEKIYETLIGDSEFMALVGKRIFKVNNTELDAISIVTPGEPLPSVKSITGLEVIIHDVTNLRRKSYITNDYEIQTTWKVFLLAWPGANGTTLNSSATRILELFSEASTIETVPLNSDIGAIAQLLVLIPSSSIILA